MGGDPTGGSRPGPGGPGGDDRPVEILLVLGPYSLSGDLGALGSGTEAALAPLGARVRRVDTSTEPETVAALREPCDAVVLAPGALEHYSGWTADAVRRLEVPVVVVRDHPEAALGGLAVTPAAAASISGGGALAVEAAVEAAAGLALDRRGDAGRQPER